MQVHHPAPPLLAVEGCEEFLCILKAGLSGGLRPPAGRQVERPDLAYNDEDAGSSPATPTTPLLTRTAPVPPAAGAPAAREERPGPQLGDPQRHKPACPSGPPRAGPRAGCGAAAAPRPGRGVEPHRPASPCRSDQPSFV